MFTAQLKSFLSLAGYLSLVALDVGTEGFFVYYGGDGIAGGANVPTWEIW
jgi:hypothetical protein